MSNSLVKRINLLLAEKEIPKGQFYKDCNVSSAAFSQWKTGKTTPKLKTIEKIADYLGTTTSYLIGEEKEKSATENGDGKELVNNDWELTELLERVRDDPHIRMLFSVTKDATKEDVERAIKIIQMLKGE